MISAIEQWVKGLFLLLIGISFLEILVPKGSVSRFVQYVFSLIVLASIVIPIANGLEQENLAALYTLPANPENQNQFQQQQAAELDQTQTKQIAEIFRQKTADSVKEALVAQFPGITYLQVVVYINQDIKEKTFGQIEQVQITTETKAQQELKKFVSGFLQIEEKQISIETPKEGGNNP